MAKLKVAQELIDLFYPVGTYYETSNTNFNPNTEWGGTWVEDSKGRVTVSMSTDSEFNNIGKTGGEKSHKLTINEIPSHSHTARIAVNQAVLGPSRYWFGAGGTTGADPSNSNVFSSSIPVLNTGGDKSHNNIQPYIVVKRWHRTA